MFLQCFRVIYFQNRCVVNRFFMGANCKAGYTVFAAVKTGMNLIVLFELLLLHLI